MKANSKICIILFFLYLICFIKCYSIKFKNTLVANDLKYPVSMNEFIHNKSLKVVDHHGYDIVDHFSFKIKKYYFSFGKSITSKEADLSNKINSLVHKKGGDGIVNFALSYNEKFGSKYYYNGPLPYMTVLFQLSGWWLTTLIVEYFFPKVFTIDAEGDIIKFK